MQTSKAIEVQPSGYQVDESSVRRLLSKRSFATIATTSAAGRAHAAGVLYEIVGDVMYVNTLRGSRKARNVVSNANIGVCVPVRRLPVGPPSSILFQAEAELLALDHPDVKGLIAGGHLKSLTGHGELDHPDGCFVRISLPRRVNTYGLGMSLRKLIADPLSAGGSATLSLGR